MTDRFDVIYDEKGVHMDYHYCREWDENGGCHGTNPDHGSSFEEARKLLVSWHEEEAVRLCKMTLEQWKNGG